MFGSRPKRGNDLKPENFGEAADSSAYGLQKTRLADELPPAPHTVAPTVSGSSKTSNSSNKRKPPKRRLNFAALARLDWSRWLRYMVVTVFAFICLAAISFLLTWQTGNASIYKQKAGEVAAESLVAPKDLSYTSPLLTNKAQDEAATSLINNVYQHDQQLVTTNRERLNHLLNTLNTARVQPDVFGVSSYNLISNEDVQAAHLTIEQIHTILSLNNTEWNDVNQQSIDTYGLVMARDIHSGQLSNEVKRFNDAITNPWNFSLLFARLSATQRKLVVTLVTPYLAENSPLDMVATQQRQAEARQQVAPVQQTLKKSQDIVRQGEVITPLQAEEVAQFSSQAGVFSWQSTIGTVGVVATLLVLLLSYFSLLFNQVWGHPRILTFLGLLLVISAAAIRIAISDPADHTLRPFLVPLATISLLLTALFDINLALFMTMLLALLAGYVGQSSELTAVVFAGGTAGALIVWKAERTVIFAYAGAAIAGAQFVVALCFTLVNHTLDLLSFGLLLGACAANALISTSLAFFSFSVLGKFFGVTTVLSLLELAHPNQPLLRRLMREAPGTYHHSVMVSNLAEQAAEQIAGEALLARVGAYYHDIGKLARPACFIDNQGSGPNIHDTLDPRESAKIIRAHVADGVELARKNNLPRRVVDIIHQHHGTCMVSFFYNKAVGMGLDVNEIDFRYPGPKPQTKIAAIVMLADGCEAAVRANVQAGRIPTGASSPVPGSPNSDPTLKKTSIAAVVNKIIDDRLNDHQLDECNLTLRDIEEIRLIYIKVLNDMYHPRINYPDSNQAGNSNQAGKSMVVTPLIPEIAALPAPALAVSSQQLAVSQPPTASRQQLDTEKPSDKNPKRTMGGIGGAGRLIK